MRSKLVRLVPASLAVALLIAVHTGIFVPAASGNVSDVSAIAAAPSPKPTFFSELAPAVMVPPRDSSLPVSGSAGQDASAPWPKLFGVTLAFGGLLFVFTALRMRPQNDAYPLETSSHTPILT